MVKFLLFYYVYCGVYLHCSFVTAFQESCLGTVEKGEHTRSIFLL